MLATADSACEQRPEIRGNESQKNGQAQRNALEAWRSSLDFGKTFLKDRPQSEFVSWSFAKLPEAIKDSVRTLEWVLQDTTCPPTRKYPVHPIELKAGFELGVKVYAAKTNQENDLVEYRWLAGGRPIRVVVSLNAIKIDLELDQLAECGDGDRGLACVNAARAWAGDVIKLNGEQPTVGGSIHYRVMLPWPDKLVDGIWFSSSPDQNIMRLRGWPRWDQRVDAFVENGTLSVLIYRKIGQLMGYQDGSEWFDDAFRRSVLQGS